MITSLYLGPPIKPKPCPKTKF